jgi:hypothetical protein
MVEPKDLWAVIFFRRIEAASFRADALLGKMGEGIVLS